MFLKERWEEIWIFHLQQCIKIKRFKESGGISLRKGQGRKPKLNNRDLRSLRRHCIKNRHPSISDISTWAQDYFGKPLSSTTIRSYIHKCQLKLYCAKRKPYVNSVQKRRRLLWARRHLGWTITQWKRVLWSDEHSAVMVKMAPVYVACRLASLLLCVVSIFLSVSNCHSPLVYDRQLLLDIKDSVMTTYNSELASSVVRSQSCFPNFILDIPDYLRRWHPDISRRKRRRRCGKRGGVGVKLKMELRTGRVSSIFRMTRNLGGSGVR